MLKKIIQTDYDISIERSCLAENVLKLAFLTDLHECCRGEETAAIFRILENISPDVVLCGGDMIDGKDCGRMEETIRFMEELCSRYTVCHAFGNHEYRSRWHPDEYPGIFEYYVQRLRKAGVSVLDNASTVLRIGEAELEIFGYDLPRVYFKRMQRNRLLVREMRQVIGEPDPGRVSVLLAHNPDQMQAYFQWKADLVLCGHYHGGIVRFGEHRGLISPNFELFSDKAYGEFSRKGRKLIISSGCGEHGIPVRVNNPREVVGVTVHVNCL